MKNTCIFCQRGIDNPGSLASHEKFCSDNPNKAKRPVNRGAVKNKGCVPWNKGLTAKIDSRVSISDATKLKLSAAGKKRRHSNKTKKTLSRIAIDRKLGGITQSRWIRYKGRTLGSSYELIVVKSLDENNVLWDTCKRFNYIDPTGKSRTYTPDLYLAEYDVYLDPKNDFLIENINPNLGFSDKEKIKLVCEQNNIKVFILNKNQLNWNIIKELIAS